ncbi:hypothetical protein E5288_WYG009392 [Bos mutus]|uniref:Uncharacterized protein n=1 Tax=Bos mutus TaxID=72004 RepID=A0A6B0R8K5_9CETA|nr:hypothetical protein [Bos mutus]
MPADTKAGPQPPCRIARTSHPHLAPWRRAHRSLQRGFRRVRTTSLRASQCGVEAFPEKVPRSEASTFSASHHVAYFEASAKLRLNVDEAFEQLVRALRGQHIRSAMDKPRSGKTTFVIMVSPLPGTIQRLTQPIHIYPLQGRFALIV